MFERKTSAHAPRRALRPLLGLAVLTAVLSVCLAGQPSATPALAGPPQPDDVTITLQPTPATIQGCETIIVNVWVNDVVDLYGADVRLSFDPAVLEVVDSDPGIPGVQLENGGFLVPPLFVVRNVADNTAGTIQYAATQLNPTPPANGSGVLVRIRFRARSVGSSALHFTYTKLSDRDGGEIPATPSDGSVSTATPGGSTLSIARLDSSTARLTWTAGSGVAEYHLYRATTPYFTPVAPPYVTTAGLSYDDAGALGNVNTNYFYVVRAACETGLEGVNSNRVGEFDFELRETAGTDYTWIALPLNVSGVGTASALASHVEANSTGAVTVRTISRWNATAQTLGTYFHQLHIGDFAVSAQSTYRVEADIASGSTVVWTQVGGVPDIGSYHYTLLETASTDYNWVMQPLDRTGVTLASALATDIETNASAPVTVRTISRWNTTAQSFGTYFHQLHIGDFATRIGYPYRVEVDVTTGNSVIWP